MDSSEAFKIGQLTAAVTTLTDTLTETNKRMDTLTARLETLENKYRTGRGLFFGMLIALGFVVYGAKGMLAKLLGVAL